MPVVRATVTEKEELNYMNLKKPEGPVIADVTAGSPAEQAGIKAGWRLIRIDNQPPGDIINYRILESDDRISLLLLTDRGILRRVALDPDRQSASRRYYKLQDPGIRRQDKPVIAHRSGHPAAG